jgi:predicted PurR-regulated permease PerM
VNNNFSVSITPKTIFVAILAVLLVALLFYLRDLVLIVLTAVVIASAVEPAVHFFMRHRISRLLSVILIYLITAGVFFGILFFFVPPVLNDTAAFLNTLPEALSTFDLSTVTHGILDFSLTDLPSSAEFLEDISSTLGGSSGVFAALSTFFGGLVSFILIIVFSFYFSVQETGVDDFLRVVTPIRDQSYVLHLWKRSQDKIGKWMQGQLVLGLVVGVLIYLGLSILGVPNALLLAVLAAVFELIPVFGQFLAAIPAVILAFTDGGLTAVLLVIGLYVLVQQFEAHLIYPVVVKKVVGVPPLLVILALLIGYELAGFLGILLSVPIAAAIQEFVADVDRVKTRALALQLARRDDGLAQEKEAA